MMPRKLPGGDYSHTGAWAYLRANQLKHAGLGDVLVLSEKGRGINSDWTEFDTVYLYHTMDFEPEHPYTINIFDGPQEHTAKYFERLIWKQHENIKLISLDYPMPNYGYRCKRKRDRADVNSKMSDYWKNVDWDAVQTKCENTTEWVLDPGVQFTVPYVGRLKEDWIKQCVGIKHLHRHLIVGDSHAPSAYKPKSLIIRKDGRTLGGILKKTIKREVEEYGYDWNQIDSLTCYWGNIDVRHHICRVGTTLADHLNYVDQLIDNYVLELKKYPEKKFELVHLIPIEDESRKLPSTGYYEGTPFYGSRETRQKVVSHFNKRIDEVAATNNWSVFKWPADWYQMDGIEFMNLIMERPRSVHLARRYYRWDLEQDIPNSHHSVKIPAAGLLEF